MTATVLSIVYSPQPGSFNRKSLPEATLLTGYGIDGDRKAGNPKRNLNIMDQETLDILDAEGIPSGPGVLGENMILAGVRLDATPPGTRIRIGQQALVEMVALTRAVLQADRVGCEDARLRRRPRRRHGPRAGRRCGAGGRHGCGGGWGVMVLAAARPTE